MYIKFGDQASADVESTLLDETYGRKLLEQYQDKLDKNILSI